MKFLIFLLIATLGFADLPVEILDKDIQQPIEEQILDLQNTVSLIATEENIKEKEEPVPEKLSIDLSNPYWEKVIIQGDYEIDLNVKTGKHGLIMELPKNFIVDGNYSFKNMIYGTAILDLEVANINEHQYLFLQHRPDMPVRIYKDSLNPNIINIAVAKTQNPYPYKVVLDPGHGGHNSGASHFGVHEKDIVLDIALRMEHKLKDMGIDVFYTRKTDEFIELRDRARMSNEINPDAFISIHINGSSNKNARGIATFLYTPNGFQKKEREALARAIQDCLIEEFPDWKDWGLLRDRFYVLRNTKNPSVLVEFGFLSNPVDRSFLVQEEIRERAAKAIAKGIDIYLKNNDGY
ncbi:MAG: N-acetylmuramoyl-L-alanine amidase [Caldanaerobacter sp.]|nr:N-acetylmuramoyl-L-alanine amidase [Caldanaerobacter sp.]